MKLVTVFTAISVNEVHFVQSILDSEQIPSLILDETIGQLAPHYLFGQGGVRLAVYEDSLEAAKKVISDYEQTKRALE